MTLTLSSQAESRIAEHIRSGRYPSPEAVVEAALAGLADDVIDPSLDADDVAALNEAEAQIDRGEGMDLDALRAVIVARARVP